MNLAINDGRNKKGSDILLKIPNSTLKLPPKRGERIEKLNIAPDKIFEIHIRAAPSLKVIFEFKFHFQTPSNQFQIELKRIFP